MIFTSICATNVRFTLVNIYPFSFGQHRKSGLVYSIGNIYQNKLNYLSNKVIQCKSFSDKLNKLKSAANLLPQSGANVVQVILPIFV